MAYLSILLLVCSENVDVHKIIAMLIAKKQVNNFAKDVVNKAEGRSREADKRRREKPNKQNEQAYAQAEIDISEANHLMGRVRRTDYYAKVITSDSVEPIFGQIYTRIAQGMKDKAVENDEEEDVHNAIYVGP